MRRGTKIFFRVSAFSVTNIIEHRDPIFPKDRIPKTPGSIFFITPKTNGYLYSIKITPQDPDI